MSSGVTVNATVRIVIEIEKGLCGGDCSLAQVYKQAREEAINKVQCVFDQSKQRVRVISADVTAVLVPEK